MKGFSIGRAMGDGFGLIARRPLSVFVWGLLMVAPMMASFGMMLPLMAEVFADLPPEGAAAEAEAAYSQAMMAKMMQFQLGSMLANIAQYVGLAVVYAAIFRAVLRPRETSFFSLRLGMDELRVAVVGLAIGVALYAALMAVILLGAAIGFGVWSASATAAVVVIPVLILAAAGGAMWWMARVSLMAPASVLYRDFAFSQGWRLGAGRGWSLFGLQIVVLLCLIAIEIVVVLIGVGVFLALGGGATGWWESWAAAENPFGPINGWLAANWYWVVLACAVFALVYGVLMTLAAAPFASACRQLADGAAPAPAVAEPAGSPAPAA